MQEDLTHREFAIRPVQRHFCKFDVGGHAVAPNNTSCLLTLPNRQECGGNINNIPCMPFDGSSKTKRGLGVQGKDNHASATPHLAAFVLSIGE